jgi:hypothetical protein
MGANWVVALRNINVLAAAPTDRYVSGASRMAGEGLRGVWVRAIWRARPSARARVAVRTSFSTFIISDTRTLVSRYDAGVQIDNESRAVLVF